jgi:lipopolysaccharide transport system permease protein
MAGAVEGFRWAMLGGVRPELSHIALASVSGIAVLASGLVYFKRMERVFADIV